MGKRETKSEHLARIFPEYIYLFKPEILEVIDDEEFQKLLKFTSRLYFSSHTSGRNFLSVF